MERAFLIASVFLIMADSFSNLTYHFIWSTKNRTPWISEDLQPRLWEYLAGIAHQKSMNPLCIGGTFDHVHVLVGLPTTMTVSQAVQLLKGPSSKWLKETFKQEMGGFQWQDGYGAFTVSQSQVEDVFRYVKNQKEHHRLKTFEEEFVGFLERNGIVWKKEYLLG